VIGSGSRRWARLGLSTFRVFLFSLRIFRLISWSGRAGGALREVRRKSMIERAMMLGIDRDAQQGRIRPVIAKCIRADGTVVDLFCKLSVGCEEGVVHLAKEAIGACLAADLGLPVPQPFLVEIPSDLYGGALDRATAHRLRSSAAVAFGSRRLPNQFQRWQRHDPVSAALLPMAQAVFLFDAIIQNPDRSEANPNCLKRGDEVRIIDP
jgi:hypothetical protein